MLNINEKLRFLLPALFFGFILAAFGGCTTIVGHHKTLTCATCHDGKATPDSPALKKKENPSTICKECHDLSRSGDHHPEMIEAGPFGRLATIAPGFALKNGRMECLTCHHMHEGEVYTSGTKFFLLGGPYKDRRGICLKCHQKKSFSRMNPHIGRDEPEKGRKVMICLTCHFKGGDESVKVAKEIKASEAFLCWRCHEMMEAAFLDKHFGLDSMTATGLDYGIGKVEVELSGDLTLDNFKRVTCTTCHDPHRPYDPQKKKREKGRINPRSDKVCPACHQGGGVIA